MPDDDDAVWSTTMGLAETELPNARSHFIHSNLRDVARVPERTESPSSIGQISTFMPPDTGRRTDLGI